MKISFFSRIKKFAVNARKKSKGITLGEFTRSYADERRKEGEKIYEGRCGSVLGMLKHLETFGGSDIPLKKVDVETIKQFIDYLRSAHDLHKNMKAPGKLSEPDDPRVWLCGALQRADPRTAAGCYFTYFHPGALTPEGL